MPETWLQHNVFTLPSGLAGRLGGHLMVIFNAAMQQVGVDLMELREGERVIEIGFGPGVGVGLLARRLPTGQVCGVDPSAVMLRQAVGRNRAAIAEGRVDLRIGLASRLEWGDASFDAALSLNNVALWEPLPHCLREVHRVLRPGGRIVIGENEWAASGQGSSLERLAAELPDVLASAGFSEMRVQQRRHLIGRVVYLSARA